MRKYVKYMVITHTDMEGWYHTHNSIIGIYTDGEEGFEGYFKADEELSQMWGNVLDEMDDMIQKTNGIANHYELLKSALDKLCSNDKYQWKLVQSDTMITEI